MSASQFLKRAITPTISLSGGFMTLFLFRRGIGFAPISLAIAIAAWIAGGVYARYFSALDFDEVSSEPSRLFRAARWLGQSAVMSLHQNVIFFVLPIWFGSSETSSANFIFPVLLGLFALFACFDDHYTKWVIAYRLRRTLANGILLFSVSVPVVALQNTLSVRLSIALCAAGAALFATLFGISKTDRLKLISIGACSALLFGGVFYFLAVFLPPVPLQCFTNVASRGVEHKDPVDIATVFPQGLPKIYVHFAVAAPQGFKQKIRFQWYIDGKKHSKPIRSKIIGGRKQGFRTRTYKTKPWPGRYRVDLETEEGQLIARGGFVVR